MSLIIGAGPAGLSVAATLARAGVATVVLDREAVAGGIPRHSAHLGFGLRDLHRFQSGPAYARRLAERAVSAGARIELDAMVTGWAGPLEVEVTSPAGRRTLAAAAIVLATGARERPRAARMIPGDRPSGVYTTGQLQQLVRRCRALGRPARGRRRRRGGQLVGRADPAPRRRPYRADDHGARAAAGSGRDHRGGPGGAAGAGGDRHPGSPDHRPRSGQRRSRSRTGAPAGGARSTATPWCSAPTGSPTTSWLGRTASTSTRARSGRSSTPPAAPAGPASSRSGT